MSHDNNQHLEKENEKKPIKTILLVEDDPIISEMLVQMITQETPFKVFSAPDALEALDLVKNMKPQLLILDYWLHTTEGLEEVPAIMLSVDAPIREINLRHMTYIKKPFDMPKLLDAIQRFLVS